MKFCPVCGAALPVEEAAASVTGEHVTKNIMFCGDGKYRWVYEMNLLKNPTIFVLVWNIFFFILLGIFAMIMIVDAVEWSESFSEHFWDNLKFMGYFLIGMTVVVGLGYLVYAAMMGWKYIVLFEMDDNGVNHIQHSKQAKKAKAIASATSVAGILSGNLSTTAAGMNVRTEMYTGFAGVKKVIRSYIFCTWA